MADNREQSEESKEFELKELENYDFCCKELRIFTTELRYKFVRYFPETRRFGLPDEGEQYCIYILISFCPWCSNYLGDPIDYEYREYIDELEEKENNRSPLEMTLERNKEWVKHYKEREKANSAEPVSAKEKD